MKPLRFFSIIAFIYFYQIQIFAYDVKTTKVRGKTYLYLEQLSGFYGFRFKKNARKIYLTKPRETIIFERNKRILFYNNIPIHLSFATDIKKGNFIISKQDYTTIMNPLFRNKSLKQTAQLRTIIIDPGHGGRDHGTTGKFNKEKNINLKIAYYLKAYLEKYHYNIYMTRSTDKTLTLDYRSKFAKINKGDLFISIHANSTKSPSIKGLETFILTPLNSSSSNGGGKRKRKVVGDRWVGESTRLGYEIHKELIYHTKAKDRGLKHAKFVVLKHTACPSVLIEAGFLSNRNEEKALAANFYQKKIALAISRGIRFYHYALTQK